MGQTIHTRQYDIGETHGLNDQFIKNKPCSISIPMHHVSSSMVWIFLLIYSILPPWLTSFSTASVPLLETLLSALYLHPDLEKDSFVLPLQLTSLCMQQVLDKQLQFQIWAEGIMQMECNCLICRLSHSLTQNDRCSVHISPWCSSLPSPTTSKLHCYFKTARLSNRSRLRTSDKSVNLYPIIPIMLVNLLL